MKRIALVLAGLFSLPVSSLIAAPPASGQLVELHACELYTGGCTASSQSTLGGRSVLRVWNFEKGGENEVDFTGLQLAILQISESNLAFGDTRPAATVIYLPEQASPEQRKSLVKWLKESSPEFANSLLTEKTARISYAREGSRISVKIGADIAFQTRAMEHCDSGSCGEQIWYSPRGRTSRFTVLVDEASSVREPSLSLVWKDHGVRNVFFGNFGGNPVSAPEFSFASLE